MSLRNLAKRVVRTVAPTAASRLRAGVASRKLRVRSAAVMATLLDEQRKFDEVSPVAAPLLEEIANNSSLIVFDSAPYTAIAHVIAALAKERITLRELVIVDITAELLHGAAISSHVAQWGYMLPLTRFKIVPHMRQDVNVAEVLGTGLHAASSAHLWVSLPNFRPLHRTLEYLLKAYVAGGRQTFTASYVLGEDGIVHCPAGWSSLDAVNPTPGIFGGPRSLFVSGKTPVFDAKLRTDAAVIAFSEQKKSAGFDLVAQPASIAARTDNFQHGWSEHWEVIHDRRWLVHDKNGTLADNRIELVCPFHRGDVILAIQVAVYLQSQNTAVRLHVAKEIVSWVHDIAPALTVEAIPVAMPPATGTYPALLESYRYVTARDDASPHIARAHPARSLSLTGENLLEYIFEQVNLPIDTLLPNHRPTCSQDDRDVADECLAKFGKQAVFVHPFGGWALKSIPQPILAEIAQHVHEANMVLVQIGGATDVAAPECDFHILENFRPSRWRAIFEKGHGLIGVDSWTAHFASILDIRQLTLFGSTHPDHVMTKRFFAERRQPAFRMGPIVNCSPCNSLTCIAFPGRSYCSGFVMDAQTLHEFLEQNKQTV